jgi:signal transduction histidine kinase
MENLLAADFLSVAKDHAPLRECALAVHSGIVQQQRAMLSVGERALGCTALRAGDMIPGGLIVLLEDVTNLSKIELMKREFIASLLHRLRSPLATLKTSFSMLNHHIADPDSMRNNEVMEIISMCSEEVDRLSSLIGDMRDLFFIETNLAEKDLESEHFPIDKAIAAAIETVKKSIPAAVVARRVDFAAAPGVSIAADFEKTKKIFSILIKNGLQYSTADSPVKIASSPTGDSVDVTVKDRGVGIKESAANLVFGKYFREDNEFTRNQPGNGLGLFIAKAYVELMKGSIYFESKQGEGTAFHVSFPQAKAPGHA